MTNINKTQKKETSIWHRNVTRWTYNAASYTTNISLKFTTIYYYYRWCCHYDFCNFYSIIQADSITSISCGSWQMPISLTMHGWSSCTMTLASPRNSSFPVTRWLGFSVFTATST